MKNEEQERAFDLKIFRDFSSVQYVTFCSDGAMFWNNGGMEEELLMINTVPTDARSIDEWMDLF